LHWLRHGAISTTSTRPRHLRRRRTHHGFPCLEDRYIIHRSHYVHGIVRLIHVLMVFIFATILKSETLILVHDELSQIEKFVMGIGVSFFLIEMF